jgi:hypothetical protein
MSELPLSADCRPQRSERVCAKCDHSRKRGVELHCWLEPPEPCFLGLMEPKIAGGPPILHVRPVIRATFPDYSCSHWEPMLPDHPDLTPAEEVDALALPTHEGPGRAQ